MGLTAIDASLRPDEFSTDPQLRPSPLVYRKLKGDGYLTEDEAIARLLPQKLKDQIVFKTERALTCLHCTEAIKV